MFKPTSITKSLIVVIEHLLPTLTGRAIIRGRKGYISTRRIIARTHICIYLELVQYIKLNFIFFWNGAKIKTNLGLDQSKISQ